MSLCAGDPPPRPAPPPRTAFPARKLQHIKAPSQPTVTANVVAKLTRFDPSRERGEAGSYSEGAFAVPGRSQSGVPVAAGGSLTWQQWIQGGYFSWGTLTSDPSASHL